MQRRHHLRNSLRIPGFRRLLATRLAGQFGDGVFQASLAGAVLFNPERQTDPAQVAAGFAVLLLPYSLIGPFAGVLLDRWWRQRVLRITNLVRAVGVVAVAAQIAVGYGGVGFYVSTLVIVSFGRFVLSALSASLPHVVSRSELVTANAVSTTTGAMLGALGGGLAIGARLLVGDGNAGYALVAAASAVPYLLAGGVAAGFGRRDLGPSADERSSRETPTEVLLGLRAGLRHICALPAVRNGLATIAVHRLLYGLTTVCTLLLYRNYFTGSGVLRAGLGGLGQVVAALAVGGALAAAVTPTAFRHVGAVVWPAALLLLGGIVQVTLVLPYTLSFQLVAALLLGFVAQGVKISVDTVLQQEVDDTYRGRVFTFYDMLFNVAVVTAAVLTAAALPKDGHSPVEVLVVAAAYVLVAAAYFTGSRRTSAATPRPRARGPAAPPASAVPAGVGRRGRRSAPEARPEVS